MDTAFSCRPPSSCLPSREHVNNSHPYLAVRWVKRQTLQVAIFQFNLIDIKIEREMKNIYIVGINSEIALLFAISPMTMAPAATASGDFHYSWFNEFIKDARQQLMVAWHPLNLNICERSFVQFKPISPAKLVMMAEITIIVAFMFNAQLLFIVLFALSWFSVGDKTIYWHLLMTRRLI